MALVRNITSKIDIPHEPGEWLILRKLTWKQLRAAEDARSTVGIEKMRAMGGELLAALAGVNRDKQTPDALNSYDVAKLLEAGIVNWSYGDQFAKELLDDLDAETAQWAAREILRLSGVGEDQEAERKNG